MIAPGMPQVSNRFDDRMYTPAFFAKNIREVVENGSKPFQRNAYRRSLSTT
jgi:hypothetical protein